MNFLRLYTRVLEMLGEESRLAWTLAIANLALAAAQFAEPILFGRIIDTLAGAQSRGSAPAWTDLLTLLGAWVAFGLFAIVCGALVALHADRLAHRQRHVVMSNYFEHILQLPMSFHGAMHSGRMLKIMLTGVDSMWWLWLGFFREHFAAFVSLLVLLPLSLFLNWRLALLLIILCVVFAGITALVVRRAEAGQSEVERHYGDLAERASDALGNVALVQSYARVDAEVVGIKEVVNKLLSAQMPVLSWWAICAVLTRASTTLTVLSIFVVGIWLNIHGLTTVGEIVTFTSFAGMLIVRLEQAVGFANRLFQDRPRLIEFFEVADTVPSVRDRSDAIDPGRVHGLVEFADASFSYDGKRAAVTGLKFTALPGEVIALVGPTGGGKTTTASLMARLLDPAVGAVLLDGRDIRSYTPEERTAKIGFILQEPFLFTGTVRDNIVYGNSRYRDLSSEQLVEVLKVNNLGELLVRFEQGLDTKVTSSGDSISLGQKQLIAFMRAVLRNPELLILDEATANIDTVTEQLLQGILNKLPSTTTRVIIAHRLNTIANADEIFFVNAGEIIPAGSMEQAVDMLLHGKRES